MISIQQLSKRYGAQVLFDDVSLIVGAGERVGLVGRNGHGKSTLLRMLTGEEAYDSGAISVQNDRRLGFLQQHLRFEKATIREEVASYIQEENTYGELDYKAEKILSGLGFSEKDFSRAPGEFSGGFQVRIQLAQLLVSEPDILLLDEPTNYLDIVSIRWLEKFLREWRGALILVTHDRSFMDRVCTHVAIIHRSKIEKFEGGTDKVYESIAEREEIYQRTLENKQKRRDETMKFVNRFRAKATKAKQVQSRLKALEREGELEALQEIDSLEFSFPSKSFSAKRVAKVEAIEFGFDPKKILFQNLTLSINPGDKIGIIGPNGMGKTTLLEVLAENLAPLSGNISYHKDVTVRYYGQTNIERLDPEKSIEDEILSVQPEHNRTRARTIAGNMMFSGDLAEKQIKVLSGGERARVLLGKLLAEPSNVLFLDEPTHHLDFYSVESLIEAIEAYPGTVLFVSHDEELVSRLAKRLIVFDDGRVELFEGDYEDFLRRIGWSFESPDTPSETVTNGSDSRLSKKEARKLRAEVISRRNKVLSPLKKEIDDLESSIAQKETRLKQANTELLEITKDGYGDDAVKLSREVKVLQEEIDESFERFEELDKEYQEQSASFDTELQRVSG